LAEGCISDLKTMKKHGKLVVRKKTTLKNA